MKRAAYQRDLFPALLTDELKKLRDDFLPHRGGPIAMDTGALEELLARLTVTIDIARQYENEIRRRRWNALAKEDKQAAIRRVIGEAGGNVVSLAEVAQRRSEEPT